MRDNLNTAENITTIFKKFPPARVKLSDSWVRNVFLIDHTEVERGALYLRGFTSKEWTLLIGKPLSRASKILEPQLIALWTLNSIQAIDTLKLYRAHSLFFLFDSSTMTGDKEANHGLRVRVWKTCRYLCYPCWMPIIAATRLNLMSIPRPSEPNWLLVWKEEDCGWTSRCCGLAVLQTVLGGKSLQRLFQRLRRQRSDREVHQLRKEYTSEEMKIYIQKTLRKSLADVRIVWKNLKALESNLASYLSLKATPDLRDFWTSMKRFKKCFSDTWWVENSASICRKTLKIFCDQWYEALWWTSHHWQIENYLDICHFSLNDISTQTSARWGSDW